MNTSKQDLEILHIESEEQERTPVRALGTLTRQFRTLLLGLLLSGCTSTPGIERYEKPSSPVKPSMVVPEKKNISSPEVPQRWDAIVGVDIAAEEQKKSEAPVFMTMSFRGTSSRPSPASFLMPSFEPLSEGSPEAVMASFPKAEVQDIPLSVPVGVPAVRTPDTPAYFSLAPESRYDVEEAPSNPHLEPRSIPLPSRIAKIPETPPAIFEHPRELIYLYLLFGVLAVAAGGIIGHERLQAMKIKMILSELEHRRL